MISKIYQILIGVFSTFVIFFYSDHFPRPFDDAKNLIFYAGCGLLFFFKIFKLKLENRDSVELHDKGNFPHFFKVCLLLYVFAFFLSLFSKPQPLGESLIEFSRVILWMGFVWVLSQKDISSLMKLLQFLSLSVWIIVPLNFLAAKGMISLPGSFSGIIPPIGHVTYSSDFMALMAWVALFGILRGRGLKIKTIFCLATLILALLGLWSTGTRASILGFLIAVGLLSFLLFQQKTFSFKKIILFLTLLIVLLLGVNYFSSSKVRGEVTASRLNSLSQVFQTGKIQDVSSGRWNIYKNTIQMIKDKPFLGWGLGTFRFAYYGYRNSVAPDSQATSLSFIMHPHNEVLHQMVSVGVLGGLAWLSFFLGIYFYGFRILSYLERDQKIILLFGLGGLTISFVSWQLSTNYLFPVSRLVTGIFFAIVFNVFKLRTTPLNLHFQNKGEKFVAVFVLASFIIVSSHQVSLYFLQKANAEMDVQKRRADLVLASKLGIRSFQTEISLAAVEFNFGDINLGIQKIEQLAKIYPSVPNVLFYQAQAKLRQNQVLEAKAILQKALQIDSSYQAAQNLLNQLNYNNK